MGETVAKRDDIFLLIASGEIYVDLGAAAMVEPRAGSRLCQSGHRCCVPARLARLAAIGPDERNYNVTRSRYTVRPSGF